MTFHTDDTICAVATAPGGAGRGIVRISGWAAFDAASRCVELPDHGSVASIGQAARVSGSVRLPLDSATRSLPCEVLLWPNSRSYTREPLVELHTLGSAPLLEAIVGTLSSLGVRTAEPGEFTLRAFLAGRIDLTQAEAVLGVIDARGNDDLDAALVQLAGGLARPLHEMREELLQLLAEVEAGLDFVEEDIEFIPAQELERRLEQLGRTLDGVAQQMAARYVAQEMPRIALVGPPNAGKSSLFNALAARFGRSDRHETDQPAAALVSSRRGTTRDFLTVVISINGRECELVDTAGVDSDADTAVAQRDALPSSEIDATAQLISGEQRARSSIRLHCVDARTWPGSAQPAGPKPVAATPSSDVVVLTKADLTTADLSAVSSPSGSPLVVTSSHSGLGLEQLAATLTELLQSDELAVRGRIVGATSNRCRESIRLARHSVERAAEIVRSGDGNELVAVELRIALEQLGTVVGTVYTDDLLDRIFGTFCIGK